MKTLIFPLLMLCLLANTPADMIRYKRVSSPIISNYGRSVADQSTSTGSAMVYVQGGTFQMGSNEDDEKPIHPVTVSSFLIGKYEVTVGDFEQFINATNYHTDADTNGGSYFWTGSKFEKKADVNWRCDGVGNPRPRSDYHHPVIHVSHNDAVAYCGWLSRRTAKTYRLPTEAEWEYAARGGQRNNGYTFSGGNDAKAVGWIRENSDRHTHSVGGKPANELGIYDMTGNVWEWCVDWYGEYGSGAQTNPTGPNTGTDRVLRGASCGTSPQHCRLANRSKYPPANSLFDIGFRLTSQSQ